MIRNLRKEMVNEIEEVLFEEYKFFSLELEVANPFQW
jgi:hypothetical protein